MSDPVRNTRSPINNFNIANVVSYIANTVVVFGIGSLGWGGRPTNGELSSKYQTIITPAGYAFAIWGPIFILQLLWCIWQLLPSERDSPGVHAVGFAYVGVCLMQIGWTLAFSWEIMWLSLIFMYGILAFLLYIHIQLQKYQKIWKGYFLWQFPFSLHLGWIIAASLVNTNLLLVAYDATTSAQMAMAVVSLALVVVLALVFLSRYPVDITPPLVLVWALGGVVVELNNPSASITASFSPSQIDGFQTGTLAVLSVVLGLTFVKAMYACFVQRPRHLREASNSAEKSGTEEQPADVEAGR